MEIAKALILVQRGNEASAWTAAHRGSRHLFPIANRPILHHHLDALRGAGLLEATILCDPDSAPAIRAAVGDGRDWDLNVTIEEWQKGAGVGDALAISKPFIGDEPVLVQGAGALLEPMQAHISAFAREGLDALALQLQRSPSASGYMLSPRAVSILTGGAGDPVTGVEASGGRVRVQPVDGCCPCDGDMDALLDSNRRMLMGLSEDFDQGTIDACVIQGPVKIHPTARVRRSLLRGPAIIGPGAEISDAYVGPYTSLGSHVVMESAEIEHSIVLARAELRFVGHRIESSVIGSGARVTRGFELPGAMRMCLGDGAEIVVR